MRRVTRFFLLACCAFLAGCSDVFNVTPYDTLPADAPRGLTQQNIELWRDRAGSSNGSMTIAFTSDPHFHFGDLTDMVAHFNSDQDIDVVIVPGDLTDQGTLQEFQWFSSVMSDLNKPWIATIGNHDHVSNGRLIYEEMFGARNFVVDLAGYRFIFFDDTVWESDLPVDLGWLENALAGTGGNIPIVIAHIPIHNDQLADGTGDRIRELIEQYEVDLFVYGHLHAFVDHPPGINGDVYHLGIPWPRTRHFVRVELLGEVITVQHVPL